MTNDELEEVLILDSETPEWWHQCGISLEEELEYEKSKLVNIQLRIAELEQAIQEDKNE